MDHGILSLTDVDMVRKAMDGYAKSENGTLVHRTAVVSEWVEFGENCIVHPYAIVGRMPDQSPALARQPVAAKHLNIGKYTVIGCHAVVFADVDIEEFCLLGDFSLVREGTVIGKRCVIGCHVSISYDCEISDDCRFQNSTVFHGSCGPGCFFGVGVICSSDRKVDLDDYAHRGSTPPLFGKKVMVGSGANIVAGVKVGDYALIGSGALVTKDVDVGAIMLSPIAKRRIEIAHHVV